MSASSSNCDPRNKPSKPLEERRAFHYTLASFQKADVAQSVEQLIRNQ